MQFLRILERKAKATKLENFAIFNKDKLFEKISVEDAKKIAHESLINLEITIYESQKEITNKEKIMNKLKNNHETPTGGHLGQTRMFKMIRREFKFNNMKKIVK